MEKQENIDFIIDACADVMPEIKKLTLGCRLRDKKGVIFHVMDRLGDNELLVITEGEVGMDMFGFGQDLQDKCKNIGRPITLSDVMFALEKKNPEGLSDVVAEWDCSKPHIEDQNSELIEKIANYLRK